MTKFTRRALVGAALAAGLAACTRNGAATTATPSGQGEVATPSASTGELLTIGLTYVPDIQFAPLYVADALGHFRDAGLQVELRHHGAQEPLLGALQTGDEDVVFAGGGEMLQGRSQGIPVVNFATAYQTYPVTIIVPEASPITTLADLRGQRVGLPGEYGENWFYLLAALAEAGLERGDLDIQSIGYTQHAALTGDKVDAVVGFLNNDVVRFGEADFAIRTISLDDPPLVSVGLGCLDDTLATRGPELVKALQAIEAGAQYCASNPEQTVELAKDYVPNLAEAEQQAYALATLKATTPLYGPRFGEQDPDRWARMATFFAEHELVAEPVAAEQAFTSDIAGGGHSVGPR